MFAEGGLHTSSQEHTPSSSSPPSCTSSSLSSPLTSSLAPQPFYPQWAAVGRWHHLERFCLNCDGDRGWPLVGGCGCSWQPPTHLSSARQHFIFSLFPPLATQLGLYDTVCVGPSYLQLFVTFIHLSVCKTHIYPDIYQELFTSVYSQPKARMSQQLQPFFNV